MMDEMTERLILYPGELCNEMLLPVFGTYCNYIVKASNTTYDSYQWTKTYLDPRLEGYPILGNYPLALSILMTYFACIYFGPKIMNNRKPFELRKFVVYYNFILSISNLFFALVTIHMSIEMKYSYVCRPIDFSTPLETSPLELFVLKVGYTAFLSRIVEFLETIIYVLRKKQNQLSFLHIYHHATVYVFSWMILTYGARGPAFQVVILNCTIHFIMYLYYGLSALGPEYRKYLWWKKHLTKIQICQFLYGLLLMVVNVFIDCPCPTWIKQIGGAYFITLLVLFSNFYLNSYRLKQNSNSEAKIDEVGYAIRDEKKKFN